MRYLVFIVLVSVTFVACKSEYQKLLERELASGKQVDSLFLDLHLGMERKDFFTKCWELNKENLLRQGPANNTVQYQIDSGTRYPVYMRFYPNFHEDKIYEMPVDFTYLGWAPWNAERSADSLLPDILNKMEEWYGGEFLEVYSESLDFSVWVKVDGNRRIRMFRKDTSTVRMEIADLNILNALKQ